MYSLVFRKRYFILAFILFLTEVVIAIFVHDSFIRPYFGDFLVVILLYCFVRTFIPKPVIPAAIGVLLFAYTVEVTQYFHLIDYLGLRHSNIARAFIGGSFDWLDLLAYTLGIASVIMAEKRTCLFRSR